MKSSKNLSTGGHWGELPPKETHKQEVITPDMIENIWKQVMDEANNSDTDYSMYRQPEFIQLPMGNLHVLNTIHLRKQLRSMEDGEILKNLTVIEDDEPQEGTSKDFDGPTLPTKRPRKDFKNNGYIKHLSPATAKGILNHAVITLLAHIGFDMASNNTVNTLTDIAEDFLKKISLLLKTASEEQNYGFPDVMEKVLVESNVGGVEGIRDYYNEYVLKYEKNMRIKVEKKMEQQKKLELNNSNAKMDLDEGAGSMQFDELTEFSNVYREVPTLQLLDPEMGFPPSLDAGFQMLHSLEQDELNSLEVDEEHETNASSSSPSAATQQRTEFKL